MFIVVAWSFIVAINTSALFDISEAFSIADVSWNRKPRRHHRDLLFTTKSLHFRHDLVGQKHHNRLGATIFRARLDAYDNEEGIKEIEEELPFSWPALRSLLSRNFLFTLGAAFVFIPALIVTKVIQMRDLGRSIPFDPRFSNLATAIFIEAPISIVCSLKMTKFFSRFLSNGSPALLKKKMVTKIMGNRFRPGRAFLASAAIGIQAGILEETLFRGIIQTALTGSRLGMSTPLAIMLQSLVFGLLHWTSLEVVAKNAAAGLLYGIHFAVRRNLLPVIIAHALWNTFIIFMAHVMETTDLFSVENKGNAVQAIVPLL